MCSEFCSFFMLTLQFWETKTMICILFSPSTWAKFWPINGHTDSDSEFGQSSVIMIAIVSPFGSGKDLISPFSQQIWKIHSEANLIHDTVSLNQVSAILIIQLPLLQ